MANSPAKSWDQLSPAYQKRMARAGLNAKNWNGPDGAALRQAARGHGKTPEHPERAQKHPEKYKDYLQTRSDLIKRVIARKERVFGDRLKWNPGRANKSAMHNPRTDSAPSVHYMRRFLKMSDAEIDRISWSEPEWGFLFYH